MSIDKGYGGKLHTIHNALLFVQDVLVEWSCKQKIAEPILGELYARTQLAVELSETMLLDLEDSSVDVSETFSTGAAPREHPPTESLP